MKQLSVIQARLKAPKGQFNKFGNYRYRSAEDIIEAVKPLLAAEGCYLVINDYIDALGNRYYVRAVATIYNAEGESISAQAQAREDDTKKGMDAAQVTGSASSYARKYALNGLFAIDDTKDADSPNVMSEVEACRTEAELRTVWSKYPSLQTDEEFKEAVVNKRKTFKI